MANLPATVDIGPHTLAVKEVRSLKDGSQQLDGDIVYGTMTIRIVHRNHVSKKREVLVHETLHGIFRNLDLDREWGQKKLEGYCFRIAPALLDVLRRNPALVAFLVGE